MPQVGAGHSRPPAHPFFVLKQMSVRWYFLFISKRVCSALLRMYGDLIFGLTVQFSKLASVRKTFFHQSCGNCESYGDGISQHLYFSVKTTGKFDVLDGRYMKQLIPYHGPKLALSSFQRQKFIIKPHKKITNYPGRHVVLSCTKTLQWTFRCQSKLYMCINVK